MNKRSSNKRINKKTNLVIDKNGGGLMDRVKRIGRRNNKRSSVRNTENSQKSLKRIVPNFKNLRNKLTSPKKWFSSKSKSLSGNTQNKQISRKELSPSVGNKNNKSNRLNKNKKLECNNNKDCLRLNKEKPICFKPNNNYSKCISQSENKFINEKREKREKTKQNLKAEQNQKIKESQQNKSEINKNTETNESEVKQKGFFSSLFSQENTPQQQFLNNTRPISQELKQPIASPTIIQQVSVPKFNTPKEISLKSSSSDTDNLNFTFPEENYRDFKEFLENNVPKLKKMIKKINMLLEKLVIEKKINLDQLTFLRSKKLITKKQFLKSQKRIKS